MENVIDTGAVTEIDFADVGDQQEMAQESAQESVVTLSEILSEAQDNDAGNPEAGGVIEAGNTVGNERDDGAVQQETAPVTTQQPKDYYRSQAEFDAAFSKRMASERNRNRPYVEMGQAVMDVAGTELTSEEVRAAIYHALAEKRSRANNTEYDTELHDVKLEQRVMQRLAPRQVEQNAPQPAEDSRGRAQAMIATMNAIGDEAFTTETLRRNAEAMTAWANGASPAEVYRRYFAGGGVPTPQPSAPQTTNTDTGAKRPAPERAANSGALGTPRRILSDAELDRIDAQVDSGRSVSFV